jgi:hypothetical protein
VTAPGPGSRLQAGVRWIQESDAALSIFLVLLLLSTVFAWPLRVVLPNWVFDLFLVGALVFGVLAVSTTPRIAAVAAILGLVVTGQRIAGALHFSLLETLPALGYFSTIGLALLLRVFSPGQVNIHRLLGAVALFVNLGVTWGLAFHAVEVARPGSILSGGSPADIHDVMWLSFETITTVGYGDVVPVGSLARSLAVIEGLGGVLYPSVLVGFLLSDVARGQAMRGPDRR